MVEKPIFLLPTRRCLSSGKAMSMPPRSRDSTAFASDDRDHWGGSSLVVQLTANSETTDRVSILNVGNVTLEGTDVKVSGVVVGNASSTSVMGSAPLTIAFNASANNGAIQEVVQAIGFESLSEAPSTATRTLSYTLTDSLSALASDSSAIECG